PPEADPAWQPFTARGVAAFGTASWRRLSLVQLLVALFLASMMVWLTVQSWFPAIERSIAALPDSARIQERKLSWPAESPILLAENRFLSFAVDLEHEGGIRSAAHLNVELGRDNWTLSSIFIHANFPYA